MIQTKARRCSLHARLSYQLFRRNWLFGSGQSISCWWGVSETGAKRVEWVSAQTGNLLMLIETTFKAATRQLCEQQPQLHISSHLCPSLCADTLEVTDVTMFDINDALKHYMSDPATISTPEADSNLVDCENDVDSLTNSLINSVLNPIIDSVADNPDFITRSSSFDSLQFLLKCVPVSRKY